MGLSLDRPPRLCLRGLDVLMDSLQRVLEGVNAVFDAGLVL